MLWSLFFPPSLWALRITLKLSGLLGNHLYPILFSSLSPPLLPLSFDDKSLKQQANTQGYIEKKKKISSSPDWPHTLSEAMDDLELQFLPSQSWNSRHLLPHLIYAVQGFELRTSPSTYSTQLSYISSPSFSCLQAEQSYRVPIGLLLTTQLRLKFTAILLQLAEFGD